MWSINMWSIWLLKAWKHNIWCIATRQDIYLITTINMRQHMKRRNKTTKTYRQHHMKRLDWINETSRQSIYLIAETDTRYKQKQHDWTYEIYSGQNAKQHGCTTETCMIWKTKHSRKINKSYPPMYSEDEDDLFIRKEKSARAYVRKTSTNNGGGLGSRINALQKPNCWSLVQGLEWQGLQRHLPSRSFVHVELRDGVFFFVQSYEMMIPSLLRIMFCVVLSSSTEETKVSFISLQLEREGGGKRLPVGG